MNSIKTKLTLLISAIIAGAVAVIVIISMISLNLLNNASFDSFMRPLADQCANTVSTYVQEKMLEVTNAVSSDDILYAATDVDVISYFYSKEKRFSSFDYAYFKADGTYVVSNSNRSTKYAANSIFTKIKGTKAVAVSSPIFDLTGEIYYLIGAPLVDSDGNVIGILIMSYDYSVINDIVNNIQIGESGFAYMMGSSGTYITDKDPENIRAQKNPIVLAKTDPTLEYASKLHQYVLKEKSGMTSYELNGENFASGFSPIDEMDAYVIIYAPEKSFFNITAFMLICIAIGFAVTASAFILVRHLTKKIANPIIKTTKRLRSLSEGNLSDPVSIINTKDELNLLSSSLNDTVVALKKYVDVITSTLINIADGNLTDRVHGSFKGDFIRIKSTFNTIIESLIDTFTNINTAAEEVNSGAGQVSNGSQALSQGATEQASAIEELSTTISDISEHITTSASSAKKAAELASESVLSIDSCNKDMSKMLLAMDEIDASSNEISKIIKVIDDIAFQTNILALNAAVEAARAGSAGKGFAVVADEVRNLAAKSAQAAKQTTSLIESSIQSVGKGSVIAKQTAKALVNVVEQTEEINELVQAISESTSIQATSIIEVNSGVDQISSVVQTNTATAEESAAASEQLSSQSLMLKNMINKFRLGDKEKLFGKGGFGFAATQISSKSEYSFSDDDFSETKSEFKFGGSLDEDEPKSEFKFGGSFDEDEPKSEFKFGSSFDEDEPKSEFKFGGSFDEDEPKSEFKFGSSFDENEPKSEFKFGNSFEDDNDKY